VDHLVPLSRGGVDDDSNRVTTLPQWRGTAQSRTGVSLNSVGRFIPGDFRECARDRARRRIEPGRPDRLRGNRHLRSALGEVCKAAVEGDRDSSGAHHTCCRHTHAAPAIGTYSESAEGDVARRRAEYLRMWKTRWSLRCARRRLSQMASANLRTDVMLNHAPQPANAGYHRGYHRVEAVRRGSDPTVARARTLVPGTRADSAQHHRTGDTLFARVT
jgi:hypothetical protein